MERPPVNVRHISSCGRETKNGIVYCPWHEEIQPGNRSPSPPSPTVGNEYALSGGDAGIVINNVAFNG